MINRDPKTHARHLTESEVRQVAEYAAKHGQWKTAQDLGLSRSPIIRAMKIHGVKSWPNGRPRQYTEEDHRQWRLFKGTTRAASHYFGVAPSTIRRALNKTPKRAR